MLKGTKLVSVLYVCMYVCGGYVYMGVQTCGCMCRPEANVSFLHFSPSFFDTECGTHWFSQARWDPSPGIHFSQFL